MCCFFKACGTNFGLGAFADPAPVTDREKAPPTEGSAMLTDEGARRKVNL